MPADGAGPLRGALLPIDDRLAMLARPFLGAMPPVDLRAVCLVRAIAGASVLWRSMDVIPDRQRDG